MHFIFERLVKAKYTFVKVASLRKKLDDTKVVNRRRDRQYNDQKNGDEKTHCLLESDIKLARLIFNAHPNLCIIS
jgi:hypothetical protein